MFQMLSGINLVTHLLFLFLKIFLQNNFRLPHYRGNGELWPMLNYFYPIKDSWHGLIFLMTPKNNHADQMRHTHFFKRVYFHQMNWSKPTLNIRLYPFCKNMHHYIWLNKVFRAKIFLLPYNYNFGGELHEKKKVEVSYHT